jgi:hypothetical protein
LLVGNFGSGCIAGPITLQSGWDGRDALSEDPETFQFGNGAAARPENTLFFAAGIDYEEHGLFGLLTPLAGDGDRGDDDDDRDDN